jgi:hypothetical protein
MCRPEQGREIIEGARIAAGTTEKKDKTRTRGGNSLINATALLAPINASVFSASSELVSYNSVWVAAMTWCCPSVLLFQSPLSSRLSWGEEKRPSGLLTNKMTAGEITTSSLPSNSAPNFLSTGKTPSSPQHLIKVSSANFVSSNSVGTL